MKPYKKLLKISKNSCEMGQVGLSKKILHLQIHTVKYTPLNGGSYIALPKTLQTRCSILNIRNYDNSWFEYCVIAALHGLSSTHVNHYLPCKHELNMTDILLPVSISKINKFEKIQPYHFYKCFWF